MQPSVPPPRKHKVLMSFNYRRVWSVVFWNSDRMRTPLPRKARFNSDEAMIEFSRRAGGPKTLEDRNIFDMLIQRGSGEVTLVELTDEQYSKLQTRRGLHGT
jgi:hypothetical protein